MSARIATRIAWSVCAVTLLLQAVALLLIFLGWSTPLPNGWNSWQGQAISFVGLVGAPILGGFVSSRRPENPYGWLWLGFALASTLLFCAGLCCLRVGGAARISARSSNGRYSSGGCGVDGGGLPGTFPRASVPHRTAALAPLAVRGVGSRRGRSNDSDRRSFRTQRR